MQLELAPVGLVCAILGVGPKKLRKYLRTLSLTPYRVYVQDAGTCKVFLSKEQLEAVVSLHHTEQPTIMTQEQIEQFCTDIQ